mmetsp:Transcript_1033/g.2017  ORF Transcript_1033/g.2017 Transcript_1033/m.2017 type:complete len:310 (+) Transcript_1033:235-1164(+)
MPMHHYHKSSMDTKVSNGMKESRECYCNGRDKYSAGDYETAFELFNKAVQMQEVLFGKYHEDTVKSYWWLGKAASHQNEPQEALKAFQRATRTGEVALGKPMYLEMVRDIEETLAMSTKTQHSFKKNKKTSDGVLHGGSNMNNTSRTSGSSTTSTRSLRLSGGLSSPSSSSSSKSPRRSLRASFSSLSSPTKKKKQLMKVLQDIIAHEQEGDRYFKEGRYTKANDYYGKALKLQDQTMGTDSLDGADIRCKLAYSMLKDDSSSSTAPVNTKQQEAAQTLQLAYECYVDKVGKDHPATYGVAAKIKTIVA